jgi:small subunit ribosomal protein S17e
MGRIKTKKVKRVTKDIFSKFGDKFTTDFNANKAVVNTVANVRSKKLRNVIAGYCTRLFKQKKEF